ncbi:cation-translocating P-type ATPase [Omnitrophica bacterium]|nr:cation-translocating P-type ATPase [Candidatus Omnitrophota bacterium]
MSWCYQSVQEVAQAFAVEPAKGLSADQVREQARQFGANELPQKESFSAFRLFLSQFQSLIIWVLVAAAGMAYFLGEWIDALAILVIIILNAVLGFVQEYQAEQSLASLRKLSDPTSRVLRNGEVKIVHSREIVPGDIVILEAGDKIPADGRLIEAIQLRTSESSLTGESVPVDKHCQPLPAGEHEPGVGDRLNMVFMGTSVVNGRARMVVTGTGIRTELGKIAAMLESTHREKTPLQDRLDNLGKKLVGIFLLVVTAVFILGLFRGISWMEMLLTSLSLAVAAIPEGLPAVVTVALAFGVRKMAKRNALIRRLPSVETLGCATVICTDKTGTLTQNEMTVQKILAGPDLFEVSGGGYDPSHGEIRLNHQKAEIQKYPDLQKVLRTGVLCNSAYLQGAKEGWRIIGDPTEGALLSAAGKARLWKDSLEQVQPFLNEIPFNSERKRMSVLRKAGQGSELFVKGAPDVLLRECTRVLMRGQVEPMTPEHLKRIRQVHDSLAGQAFRVLAVACKSWEFVPSVLRESDERELVFAGFFAMMDPPRPEARSSIEICQRAGIKPVMITGDHKVTAVAIAKELQMMPADGLALSGSDLDEIDDAALKAKVDKISVYARVSAEHKMRIIRAFKERDEVVAMTGDGVNDAPAIKEADIGVAMGITGTDVTKEAADMVITDDHFASIVNAVEEGRGIYDNIVKFVKFLLAFNLAEIFVLFTGILIGFKAPNGHSLIPLTAVQILWMNLVTDGFPAIALGLDPVAPFAMQRPPRPARASMFTREFIRDLIVISVLAAAGALAACFWGSRISAEYAQTMTLTALVMLELVGVQMVREDYQISLFSNRWLVVALVGSLLIQVLILYIPPFQAVFGTVALGLIDWVLIIFIVLITSILGKIIRKRLR